MILLPEDASFKSQMEAKFYALLGARLETTVRRSLIKVKTYEQSWDIFYSLDPFLLRSFVAVSTIMHSEQFFA